MFKAVLFDLDGTLLDIDMNIFIRKYFGKMVQMARERGLETKGLIELLWKSTAAMIENKDPLLTNIEVFERDFFKDPVYKPEVYRPFFDEFYDLGFEQLKDYAGPFPETRQVMDEVFSRGCKVVIATQPVFPDIAIRKRLDWAGVGSFDYQLVTTYEIMHYTKPHTEYYLEIAESIGVDPRECLMVGNDVGEDLTASLIGMKTFLVKERLINQRNLPINADWQGYLPDLLAFVKQWTL
ncbi:MAG: HAD family hydrolase [Syntrophomonadales bacterium]